MKQPTFMMLAITRFLQLMLGALVVGTMFAVWAGYDPRGLSYQAYLEQHQGVVGGLNVLVPALAAITILLTLFSAWLQRTWQSQRVLLVVATLFLVAAGLTTRFGNQPINALVVTWTADAPPTGWESLRADWWTYHLVRMCSGTIGYALIVWSVVRPPRSGE